MSDVERAMIDHLFATYGFQNVVNYFTGLLLAADGDPTKVKLPNPAADLEAELATLDWTAMIRETER